jgi:predicted RNA-binding protein with PIN domain
LWQSLSGNAMKTAYVIDGYNLIHAVGMLAKKAGLGELERARLALLALLHGHFGTAASAVTVVFDAARSPRRSTPEQEYQGLKVLFATGGLLADDVIETLIRDEAAPKQLTVVSNDHRLQQAARRRQARVLSCEEFIDMLMTPASRNRSSDTPTSEKTEPLTDAERQRLLQEFGHLDKDLKDLDFQF